MSNLNETAAAFRVHIAFFGRRNAGKSSLVNAFTGQSLSVVSPVKGTTTDPVSKAMELLPLGPVQIIDTPGMDDRGELGALRVAQAKKVLDKTDLAIVVTDATEPVSEADLALLSLLRERQIPYLLVRNKIDLPNALPRNSGEIGVSALTGEGVGELRSLAAQTAKPRQSEGHLVGDLLKPGDGVVLVVPIDKAAPKGRLILPQQQTIRDILDAGACALVCRDTELTETLSRLAQPPKLVITDSQVFGKVNAIVPPEIPLTSFSILMARFKGNLCQAVAGAAVADTLKDGDKVLIAEGCTHHRQCEDIGTVKLPGWLRRHTGSEPEFHFVSGGDFPENLEPYKLVIHCGGCMLTPTHMATRYQTCKSQNVPITNYGILIAHLNGILNRTLSVFHKEIG